MLVYWGFLKMDVGGSRNGASLSLKRLSEEGPFAGDPERYVRAPFLGARGY
jgi:hypothetical protein